MDIVQASGSQGKCKRRDVNTASNTTTFVVEIGDKPQDPVSIDFDAVGTKVINQVTKGNNEVFLL